MPLPRLRFTVQRTIMAVAVVGVSSGAIIWCMKMRRLSRHYLEVSNYYEYRLDNHAAMAAHDPYRMKQYEFQMMLKYRHLVFTPWLPVTPDLPEPD